VLKGGALLGLLFKVGETSLLLSPREARARQAVFTELSPSEQRTLEALGEILLPGSAIAGLAHFVDHQIAAPHGDCLLMARALDIPAPIARFYRAALGAVDLAAQHAFSVAFPDAAPAQRQLLVEQMALSDPSGWQGPPAPFVFYLLRSDAIDVCYGTPDAYARLGVPYMPHLLPVTPW
jgi:hypothetical protein